jgi:threonine synthase
MWKAFDEMEQLGWIGEERPRMISVQAAGCAPIVRAWEAGAERGAVAGRAHVRVRPARAPRGGRLPDPRRRAPRPGALCIAVADDAMAAAVPPCGLIGAA